jgi:N-acetylglucosaminyldiphosphoundecaprenol N-acetyl-beta-D-mannosaminyltransferase
MSMTEPLKKSPTATEPAQNATGLDTTGVASLRRDDFDRDVWCLMGVPVDATDINRAVADIDDAVRTRRRLSFVTPNVNFLVRAMKDAGARREILNADLSLADGAPLVLMARLLGAPIPSRVAGSDLFEALRRRPGFAGRRVRVFFFGGRDGAAQAACAALDRENGGVEAAGYINPGFGDVESMSGDATIAAINAAEPDFVLVALGAAKGQAWIERNRDRLAAPVTAHLGAVVDFTAGGVLRAPAWVQRSGLEWVWRIKEEPSLWRRYVDDGLALTRLILTRLAPQIGRGASRAGGEGSVEIAENPSQTLIRLAGVLGGANLRPVREAFRAAAARGKPARLDFSGIRAVDLAFLGQMLMLEKNLLRSGAELTVEGARPQVVALLAANNMNYAAPAGVQGTPAATYRAAV